MAKALPYPAKPMEDALRIAQVIYEKSGGNEILRVDLANKLDLTVEGTLLRDLITSSGKFGFTEGSYKAKTIKPTDRAKHVFAATDKHQPYKAKREAFLSITAYGALLERYDNFALPEADLATNWLMEEFKLDRGPAQKCWQNFLQDATYLKWVMKTKKETRLASSENEPKAEGDKIDILVGQPDRALATPLNESAREPADTAVVSPSVYLNVEIHIAADAPDEKIENVFKNMKKYVIDPTRK